MVGGYKVSLFFMVVLVALVWRENNIVEAATPLTCPPSNSSLNDENRGNIFENINSQRELIRRGELKMSQSWKYEYALQGPYMKNLTYDCEMEAELGTILQDMCVNGYYFNPTFYVYNYNETIVMIGTEKTETYYINNILGTYFFNASDFIQLAYDPRYTNETVQHYPAVLLYDKAISFGCSINRCLSRNTTNIICRTSPTTISLNELIYRYGDPSTTMEPEIKTTTITANEIKTTLAPTSPAPVEPDNTQCPWMSTDENTIVYSTPTQRIVTTTVSYATPPTAFPTSTYATFEPTTPDEDNHYPITNCPNANPDITPLPNLNILWPNPMFPNDSYIPRNKREAPQMQMEETLNCNNGGGALTTEERETILNQHNFYRSQLAQGEIKFANGKYVSPAKNMYKLKYNCELEKIAQKWANNCQFEHSTFENRNAGENLYMSLSPSSSATNPAEIRNATISSASKLWWSELEKFGGGNYGMIISRTNVTFTMDVFNAGLGHWAQMAWGKTTQIGCGISQCPSTTENRNGNNNNKSIMNLLVCNYRKQGNIFGKEIYEIGSPCANDRDCTRFDNSFCDTQQKLCFV